MSLPKFLSVQTEPVADTALHVVMKVADDGSIEQDVKNGDGTNCLQLTKQLEAARGGVEQRQMKPEADRYKTGDISVDASTTL